MNNFLNQIAYMAGSIFIVDPWKSELEELDGLFKILWE
jgi:hypothetical protein